MIGQKAKKWQPFFEIQDGGNRHREFLQVCLSNVIDKLQINVAIFALNLMMISQQVMKWKQFSEIKNGGHRHFEYLKLCVLMSSICSNPKSQCFHKFW